MRLLIMPISHPACMAFEWRKASTHTTVRTYLDQQLCWVGARGCRVRCKAFLQALDTPAGLAKRGTAAVCALLLQLQLCQAHQCIVQARDHLVQAALLHWQLCI